MRNHGVVSLNGLLIEQSLIIDYFCLGSHYKITISISSSEESSLHGGEIGIMSIMITSHANDETEKLPFSKEPT